MITPFADEVARFVGKVDWIVFAEKDVSEYVKLTRH